MTFLSSHLKPGLDPILCYDPLPDPDLLTCHTSLGFICSDGVVLFLNPYLHLPACKLASLHFIIKSPNCSCMPKLSAFNDLIKMDAPLPPVVLDLSIFWDAANGAKNQKQHTVGHTPVTSVVKLCRFQTLIQCLENTDFQYHEEKLTQHEGHGILDLSHGYHNTTGYNFSWPIEKLKVNSAEVNTQMAKESILASAYS